MGKKSPSLPKPPDPVKTIAAQSAANKEALQESARINAVDIYSPLGSVTYTRGADGIPTAQHINVSPLQQGTLNTQQRIANNLSGIAEQRTFGIPTTDFSLSGLPYDPASYDTGQFASIGNQRDTLPYDPRNADVSYRQYDPDSQDLPFDPRGFNPENFAQFGDPRAALPYNPQDASTANFRQFDQSSLNLPYDPRNFDTGQFQQFGDQRGALPYDPRAQQANIAVFSDQRGAMPFDPRSVGNINMYNQDVNDAFMAQQRRNLEPQFERAYERRAQDLANRGLPIDGEAYGDAMGDLMRDQENAWIAASNNAILQSGAEAQRRLGMERALRGDAMSEAFATNNQINRSEMARLDAQRGLRDQAWREATGQNQINNQNLQRVLDAQRGLRGDAFGEAAQATQLANQAAQAELGAQQSIRGQAWQEALGQNQQQNQNLQQVLDARTRLRNQAFQEGIQGTAAANQAIAQQLQGEAAVRNAAFNEGLSETAQLNSELQQRMQIEQNLRNQALQERQMARNQNLNEASALLQGAPVMPMPQAPAPARYNLQAPDVIGAHNAAYQQQLNNANLQQQQIGSMWQGAGNLLTGFGSLPFFRSSRAFKEDDAPAERILDRVQQMPIRTWRYKREIDPRQELHIGPYAEDWKRVTGLGNGHEIAVIDAFGVLMKCVQELHDDNKELRAKLERLERRRR